MVRKILRNMAKVKMRTAGIGKPNRKMKGGAWRYWLRWEPPKEKGLVPRGRAW